jgi:hypothetical protein
MNMCVKEAPKPNYIQSLEQLYLLLTPAEAAVLTNWALALKEKRNVIQK